MTQTTQGHEPRLEEVSADLPTNQQSTTDSPSDNDASEKSAREKFKKTSLASLSKHTIPSKPMPRAETDLSTTETSEQGAPLASDDNANEVPRGRPIGKRALEDEDTSVRENPVALPDPPNGHARKRSRDVRTGGHVKGNGRLHNSQKEPVQEEAEEIADGRIHGTPSAKHHGDSLITETEAQELASAPVQSKFEEVSTLPDADDELSIGVTRPAQSLGTEEKRKAEDEDMKDGAYSPRKKRSRDQMDTEVDREQKIAATEETRAHRRSEELDRADTPSHQGATGLEVGPRHASGTLSTTEISNESKTEPGKLDQPKATFGTTNMLRPLPGSSRSKSPTKASDDAHTKVEDPSVFAPSAFASSGFASFASPSTSPFGAVSAPSKPPTLNKSAFAAVPAVEKPEAPDSVLIGNKGFGSFAKVQSSGFGTAQVSPFGVAGSVGGGTFGGSVFGGGFGGSFGSGSKLTSFAAPTGDAKLGSANGTTKPIGSSGRDNEDKDGSESESEGEEDQGKEDEFSEANDGFQHQDVETGEDGEDSIFSSRAKLYAYRGNSWKEAGNGVFKLNVISSKDCRDEQRTGRFIMRSHQTYRVLLNQPIFPQMKIGDRSGNEPTGKAFAFAVIEDGKPIPHMVRVRPSSLPIQRKFMLTSLVGRCE